MIGPLPPERTPAYGKPTRRTRSAPIARRYPGASHRNSGSAAPSDRGAPSPAQESYSYPGRTDPESGLLWTETQYPDMPPARNLPASSAGPHKGHLSDPE